MTIDERSEESSQARPQKFGHGIHRALHSLFFPIYEQTDRDVLGASQRNQARVRDRGIMPPKESQDGKLRDGVILWEIADDLPREVDELVAPFQSVIRSARMLKLSAAFVDRHSNVIVRRRLAGSVHDFRIRFVGARRFEIMPRVSCLRLDFDLSNLSSIDEVLNVIFSLRHTYEDTPKQGAQRGLMFIERKDAQAVGCGTEETTRHYAASLGPFLSHGVANAVPRGSALQPISIGAFANWLLLASGDDVTKIEPVYQRQWRDESRQKHSLQLSTTAAPPIEPNEAIADQARNGFLPVEARIGLSRYSHHHSTIILKDDIDDAISEKLSTLTRRGYHAQYAVPESGLQRDIVRRVRSNRIIGVAREGISSISWAAAEGDAFEHEHWPAKFSGIYALLHSYVLLERQTLLGEIQHLHRFGHRLRRLNDLDEWEESSSGDLHEKMRSIVPKSVGRLIHMVGGDCGGTSEQIGFIDDVRECFGINTTRAEVRRQLQEISFVIEDAHSRTLRRIEEGQKGQRQQSERQLGRLTQIGVGVAVLVCPMTAIQFMNDLFPRVIEDRQVLMTIAVYIIASSLCVLIWRRDSNRRLKSRAP